MRAWVDLIGRSTTSVAFVTHLDARIKPGSEYHIGTGWDEMMIDVAVRRISPELKKRVRMRGVCPTPITCRKEKEAQNREPPQQRDPRWSVVMSSLLRPWHHAIQNSPGPCRGAWTSPPS